MSALWSAGLLSRNAFAFPIMILARVSFGLIVRRSFATWGSCWRTLATCLVLGCGLITLSTIAEGFLMERTPPTPYGFMPLATLAMAPFLALGLFGGRRIGAR